MSCSLHLALPTPKAVRVNGVAIGRDAIAREVQNHPAAKPIDAWQSAARALAIRELLLQEARRLGIVACPRCDERERRETDEEALISGLVEQEIKTPVPDDDTCRRYYENNRRTFRSPDIYEASHILFGARQGDTKAFACAREAAALALAELERDPHCFEDLARRHSACPSAAHGGNLGQITRGQTTPEFEHALTELMPGTLCREPVATRYGFHIIRLDRKHEGRALPFEHVSARIADYLSQSVQRRAVAQYIARLANTARIEGVELPNLEAMRVI